MNTGFEANLLVVKLVRAVHGNLFEEALVKPLLAVLEKLRQHAIMR